MLLPSGRGEGAAAGDDYGCAVATYMEGIRRYMQVGAGVTSTPVRWPSA